MGKERWTQERRIVADLLRELRKQKSLSQKELAELISKAQSHISKYESGERALEIHEIRTICNACGVELHVFVNRFEEALRSKQ